MNEFACVLHTPHINITQGNKSPRKYILFPGSIYNGVQHYYIQILEIDSRCDVITTINMDS